MRGDLAGRPLQINGHRPLLDLYEGVVAVTGGTRVYGFGLSYGIDSDTLVNVACKSEKGFRALEKIPHRLTSHVITRVYPVEF